MPEPADQFDELADLELRNAFEGFRTDSLSAIDPAGPAAIRQRVQQRRRNHVAAVAAVAALTVIAGGVAVFGALGPPKQPSAAGSRTATPSASGSASSTPDTTGTPSGSQGSSAPGNVLVQLNIPSYQMNYQDHAQGWTSESATITVKNPGKEPITNLNIVLTPPAGVGYIGQDPSGACKFTGPGDNCEYPELGPGQSIVISGHFNFVGDPAGRTFGSGSVQATATRSDGSQLNQTTSITVKFPPNSSPSASGCPGGAGKCSPSPSAPSQGTGH